MKYYNVKQEPAPLKQEQVMYNEEGDIINDHELEN